MFYTFNARCQLGNQFTGNESTIFYALSLQSNYCLTEWGQSLVFIKLTPLLLHYNFDNDFN